MRYLICAAVLALTACDATLTPERSVVLGETPQGETVHQFTITRSSALGIAAVSEAAIAAQASAICPGGYRYLSGFGEATRRISGIVYTDVTVTIACP